MADPRRPIAPTVWTQMIGAAILTLVCGYFANTLNRIDARLGAIELRVVSIEVSRFTARDGVALQNQMHRLSESMATLPPDEWRRRIRAMETFLASQGYEPPNG